MANVERKGFTFYLSFYDAIKELDQDRQYKVLIALIRYGLFEDLPKDDDPIVQTIFKLIKPNIDHSIKKYDQRQRNNEKRSKKIQEEKISTEGDFLTDLQLYDSEGDPNKIRGESESGQ